MQKTQSVYTIFLQHLSLVIRKPKRPNQHPMYSLVSRFFQSLKKKIIVSVSPRAHKKKKINNKQRILSMIDLSLSLILFSHFVSVVCPFYFFWSSSDLYVQKITFEDPPRNKIESKIHISKWLIFQFFWMYDCI